MRYVYVCCAFLQRIIINDCFYFSKNSPLILTIYSTFFLCCKEVKCATRCRRRRLRLNWNIKKVFIRFRLNELFSWQIAKLCLSSVINAFSFTCLKMFSAFQRRIKCASKLLILKFYSMCLITQLIYTIIILYNSFYLIL